MSHTTVNYQNRPFSHASDVATRELGSFAGKYPGRILFATRFSPEDQVLAHLIFKSDLPLRVFTPSFPGQQDILTRSVDFFKRNVEVSFQQARPAAVEFAVRQPERFREHEPHHGPLEQVIQGHHLLVSSRRKDQFPTSYDYTSLEWDESNQRAIFYPLFDWSEQQVQAYLAYYQIPQASALPTSQQLK